MFSEDANVLPEDCCGETGHDATSSLKPVKAKPTKKQTKQKNVTETENTADDKPTKKKRKLANAAECPGKREHFFSGCPWEGIHLFCNALIILHIIDTL